MITGQSIMLMAGLLVIGFVATYTTAEKPFHPFHEFFYSKGMIFRITFPFNIAFGIPLYYQMSKMLGAY